MKKESLYRPLTIMLPILAVLCATGGSAYEWRRLKRAEGEADSARAKLADIDRELRSYQAQPQTEKYPTVDKTPLEQAQFLNSLRANADASSVQLIRWSNTTPAPAPAPPPTPDKPAPAPGAVVTPIVSVIEVSGFAPNTRQFLYNVARSRRLLNMSDIKWVRDTWPNTHLTFTLTRYVAPPVPLPLGRLPATQAADSAHSASAQQQSGGPILMPASHTTGGTTTAGVVLPNPMDAPGMTQGPYQSRLEAGVNQLYQMDRSQPMASPRPPAVSNAKR